MTDTQIHSIQTTATNTFLSNMGYNSRFARAVVFGPVGLGGIGLRHLLTEQGIGQVIALIKQNKHIRSQ